MPHPFSRTEMLLGASALQILRDARVAVFGIGGVGSYAVEGLVRAGVGKLDLIDHDRVCLTNLNRQVHATHKTVGQYKVDAMRDRVLEINPAVDVRTVCAFYLPENAADLFDPGWDYIIDAMDTVTAKLDLVVRAQENQVPLICCLGTANKLDPTRFEVADLAKTDICPLARIMRKELRHRGVKHQKVVYSKESPLSPREPEETGCADCRLCPEDPGRTQSSRRQLPGSVSFCPSVAGLIAAGEVVKDLIGWKTPVDGDADNGFSTTR